MSQSSALSPSLLRNVVRVIQKELLLSKVDAEFYFKVNSLDDLPTNHHPPIDKVADKLKEKLQLYKKHFTRDEIVNHPNLIKYGYSTVVYRIDFLKSIGLQRITPSLLLNFSKLVKLSPTDLKEQGLLDANVNLTEYFLNQLSDLPVVLKWRLEGVMKAGESMEVFKLKKTIAHEYFTCKLKGPLSDVQTEQSADEQCSTRRVATGVSMDYLKEYQTYMPLLMGRVIPYHLQKYPEIFQNKLEKLKQRVDYLRHEVGFCDEQILYRVYVVNMKLSTLKERCNFWLNHYGAVFRTHPLSVQLILKHAHCKRVVTDHPDICVEHAVREVRRNYQQVLRRSHEFDLYKPSWAARAFLVKQLSAMLSKSVKEIGAKLKEHPYHYAMEMQHAIDVVRLLQDRGLNTDQIFSGLFVVLYPLERVVSVLHRIDADETWKRHPLCVHLLVYHMDKETGSVGMGVFGNMGKNESKEIIRTH